MAAASSCSLIVTGGHSSAAGLGSREVLDRSQNESLASSSSACLASACNLRSAAASMAQNARISVSRRESELCSSFWNRESRSRLRLPQTTQHAAPVKKKALPAVEARLFGPAIFEASKLRVLFLGKEDAKGHLQEPRIYTLTHSDTTAKITLAVAQEINKAQLKGWYSKLQRDEVLAEWRKTQGEMALHVHCHISGGNFLHNLIAKLRFYIFRKELPVVLEAFIHGDRELFAKHPELQNAPVWVYFHSNMEEYNRLECWGPLSEATKGAYNSEIQKEAIHQAMDEISRTQKRPGSVCTPGPCECCSNHEAVIAIPESFRRLLSEDEVKQQQQQQA